MTVRPKVGAQPPDMPAPQCFEGRPLCAVPGGPARPLLPLTDRPGTADGPAPGVCRATRPGPRSRPPQRLEPRVRSCPGGRLWHSEHVSRGPLFSPSCPPSGARGACVICPLRPPGPVPETQPWASRLGQDLVGSGRRRLLKYPCALGSPEAGTGACGRGPRQPPPKPRDANALPPHPGGGCRRRPLSLRAPESWALAAWRSAPRQPRPLPAALNTPTSERWLLC